MLCLGIPSLVFPSINTVGTSSPSRTSDLYLLRISCQGELKNLSSQIDRLPDISEDQGVMAFPPINQTLSCTPIRRAQCLVGVSCWPNGAILFTHIYRSLSWRDEQCSEEATIVWSNLNQITQSNLSLSRNLGGLSKARTILVYLGTENPLLNALHRKFMDNGAKIELWGDPNWRYSGIQASVSSRDNRMILTLTNSDILDGPRRILGVRTIPFTP